MIYLGFFHYEFEDPKFGPSGGRFVYVVEAVELDAALEMMAKQIEAKHTEDLEGAREIMFDNVIEMGSVPADGVMLKLCCTLGQETPTMYCDVPKTDDELVRNFREGPDPQKYPDAASTYKPAPFIVLKSRPKRRRAGWGIAAATSLWEPNHEQR